MKKIKLIFLMQLIVAAGFAQKDTVAVFYNSYVAEGSKDYVKAIELMNGMYNQNSYSMNLRLGWLWYLKGDFMKSQSYYKTAIMNEAKSVEARLGYAFPTSLLENWSEVSNIYNEILVIDPENATVNYKQAYIAFYIKKDYKGALSFVSKVTRLYPFDFDANYLTAQIHLSLGNIKEAKVFILHALEYNPQSKEAQKVFEILK